MPRHRLLAAALAAVTLGGCEKFQGPVHLLQRAAQSGVPRTASITTGTEKRPALLSPARYDLRLPRRGLLTFGMGIENATGAEPPGVLRVAVRAGERTLFETEIDPRKLPPGWRDVSVPLEGLGRRATLSFDLRLTERDGREITPPPGLLLALSDPVVHDLDDYGRAKGIVLVSIDTLRRDHVGAYGYSKPTTPRLDALAREGILCEDAVSTSSWTLPAHLSMLTSADPGLHGGTDMNRGFNRRLPTLASMLKEAGYATHAVTSHLYVSSLYGVDAGFDHLEFNQKFRADNIVERGIDAVDRFGDRPFFLFLHFYDPHWHYDPHDSTRRHFETGYTGGLTGQWGAFKELDPAKLPPEDMAHILALYDGEIRYTDDELGRFLDHLKARGLDRSTLILVTSDHGEEFGEHGSWEHQKTLYEEVLLVPFLVFGPGVAARREPAPVSLLDVAPTIVAWAGLSPKWEPQGRSVLAPLADRRPAYGETDHTIDGTRKLFLRHGAGQSKVIFSLVPDGSRVEEEEWYDLASDPRETGDATPRDEVANAVRSEAVARWRSGRSGVRGPSVQHTEQQRHELRQMGYISAGPAADVPPPRPRPRARPARP